MIEFRQRPERGWCVVAILQLLQLNSSTAGTWLMCRGDLQLFNLQFPEASKARRPPPIICNISTSFRTPSVPRSRRRCNPFQR